ncbi:DUF551 domain-containing protein [Salmonella enterica subsp. enterica serovar Muenchen]|nr:DUF551 domain-containing protein [Salmonella enterica subsp. enterica serovar Muenchen]
MKYSQITTSMAKDIAFKLGAVLNDEEATIFADGYNVALLKVNKDMSTALPNNASLSTNSPVTPDSWISCSERMPENGLECLVQTNSGWRYVSFYDAHSRLFYDSPKGGIEYILVTHWMPVPAAPEPETMNG